jgi:hypothetical protein
MKTRLMLAVTLSLAAADAGAVGFESRRFTPYFNMRMSQGAYLPSQGAFFTGAGMNMRVGLLAKAAEKHSLFGLYNLNFSGQGFRFPDSQEFESKSQSHLFSFEYRWDIGEHWRFRPGVSRGKTYTQTASAEVWGDGLYDNDSLGFQVAGDYSFQWRGKKSVVTAMVSRQKVDFPNYTDILREFRGEDENTELAGGLKDQTLIEYSLGFTRGRWRARARMNNVDFKNEKVVEATQTYGGTAQKDSNLILSGGMEARVWILETSPEVRWQQHSSNQNFLLFQSATDPAPAFAPDYYDYTETAVEVPVFLNLTQKWALSGGLELQSRKYKSRQPRTADNQFKGGKQTNGMVSLSAGVRKRMNEVSSLFLGWSVVTASSNNKFERYLPYNYTGQSLTLGYQLTY